MQAASVAMLRFRTMATRRSAGREGRGKGYLHHENVVIIVKGPIELRKVADEHEIDQCGDRSRQHADGEKAA